MLFSSPHTQVGIVFQQSIWAYNVSTFLTPKHNRQHGLNSEGVKNRDRRSRLMHHIKMFTDKISSRRDKDYFKEKMDQEKVGEKTYGGALHEFCHYKV